MRVRSTLLLFTIREKLYNYELVTVALLGIMTSSTIHSIPFLAVPSPSVEQRTWLCSHSHQSIQGYLWLGSGGQAVKFEAMWILSFNFHTFLLFPLSLLSSFHSWLPSSPLHVVCWKWGKDTVSINMCSYVLWDMVSSWLGSSFPFLGQGLSIHPVYGCKYKYSDYWGLSSCSSSTSLTSPKHFLCLIPLPFPQTSLTLSLTCQTSLLSHSLRVVRWDRS